MKHLSKKQVREFQREVNERYKKAPRSFPWRDTRDPYLILVSEVMLQQTQADRVTPFFTRFVKRFPTVFSLAEAETGEVLRLWRGLGYNRRALNLHKASKMIVREYVGVIPEDTASLDALPGVGKYTAAAVLAFGFNQPAVFVETNIRTAYLHYFLKKKGRVPDSQILDLVARTLDFRKPREWYQALMDYGAMLKRTSGNENIRSAHYSKQPAFKGSTRQLRGGLLSNAIEKPLTKPFLRAYSKELKKSLKDVERIADTLVSEGFLKHTRDAYYLA